MRRTNSKEVKAAVRNYLIEVAQSEELNTIKDIKNKFINEYGWAVARLGERNACIEWLRGLGVGVDYSYEEAEKWLDKRGDGLYWDLLAREILASK